MKFGVIVFPGSNCDHDAYNVVSEIAKQPCGMIWHESEDLQNSDAIIVPGGFAYGDYLRTGAIAAFAPAMKAVKKFAARGGLVIGICNGFQILCEAGLLPGALMRNAGLKYICKQVHLRTETSDTPFTHTLKQLHSQERVVFRYSTPEGEVTAAANPNGSLENIAGICNEGRNVLGMMPHPDRSSEGLLGSADGLKLFQAMVTSGTLAK